MIAGLKEVWTPVLPDVLSALAGGKAWTPQQFAVLARRLLAAQHYALPVTEAEACLGKDG